MSMSSGGMSEWKAGINLVIVIAFTWFYEHLYCINSDILFHFLRTNVLCKSLWIKAKVNSLLSKVNVNVNILLTK